MTSRYTKTILKGYSTTELQELATGEGLLIPGKKKKTVILRLLFSHFGIENDKSIQQREKRLVEAYFDAFSLAVSKADRDTESVLGIILSRVSKSLKVDLDTEIATQARLEFVENLCNHCQKNGKEIKDCKPDYYATHFLFGQLSRLEKSAFSNKIEDPAFDGLNGMLGAWILAARLEKILEGTYSSSSGSSTQNKEGFLMFRAYFTKKHVVVDHLWKIIHNCLVVIDCEQRFAKPITKQKFSEICNWIRLFCQQSINDRIAARTSPKSPFCSQSASSATSRTPTTMAVHVVYDNNASNESLEWELQMKEATIVSLQEKLKLLQWELENRDAKNSYSDSCSYSYSDSYCYSCDMENKDINDLHSYPSDPNCSWQSPWLATNGMDVDFSNSSFDTATTKREL